MDQSYHTSIFIGDELYTWGGYEPGVTLYHDSPERRLVDVFNIINSSYVKKPTTGTPPNGTVAYSSCSIGKDIYYFGGQCDDCDSYNNNLFVLNTRSNDWRKVITSNNDEGPMKKSRSGMIPFNINGEDYLLVIGGSGPLPSNPSSHAQYTPSPNYPLWCYTNEVHIMCVSTTPGTWTVPVTTGSVFPPLSGFSINTLPGNRAIVFGGVSINEHNTIYLSNNVFMLSYTTSSVNIVKVDPTIHWPKGRFIHSSVVISGVHVSGVRNHYLVVLGGLGDDDRVTSDCCIMNIDNKEWKLISLHGVVVQRYSHSMSCYEMLVNCVWLIITGGYSGFDTIPRPNRLMIVELVFSPPNDEWTVTNVMNVSNMKYSRVLYDRVSKKQSTSTVTASEGMMKDNEKQKEVIAKLQSDLQLCKEGYMKQLMEKEKQYKAHLMEVERKLSGDKTMELSHEHCQDHIKHEEETIIDHSDDKEGNVKEIMNKQLHHEIDILRQRIKELQLGKDELIQEMDERDKRETESVIMKDQLKQDQSTQFSYMTTVNDCLDNVHVGGETVYLIQGNNAQSFNWSKWGLRMHFPEDSVMGGPTNTMTTCEVAVKALVGGKFLFPDGSELVSAVYAISFAKKLSKPVKLEIQHCAVMKNDHQCRRLSFMKAPMRQRVPPFEFSGLEGGMFSIDSQYGSITLDHFCLIGIILVVKNIPVGVVWKQLPIIEEVTEPLNTTSTDCSDVSVQTESDSAETHSHSDDDDVDLSYTGQLYYSRDGSTINQWLVRFMAVKDLNALKMYLKNELPDAIARQSIKFGFHGNNGVLELVMSHTPDTPVNRWMIRPLNNPLTIRQKHIDEFGRDDGVPSPPSCLISVVYGTRNPDDTAPDLYYCVPVRGVVCDTEEIFIHRILERPHTTSDQSSHSSTVVQGGTPHRSNEDHAVNYCEVFKNHYDDLVTAMVTSCSLSNVARGLKSVNLISQSAVDFVNANRVVSEPDQCVIRLLKELTTFLQISKNPLKKHKAMTDFCRVLHDQDSPVLSEMASQLSDELGSSSN